MNFVDHMMAREGSRAAFERERNHFTDEGQAATDPCTIAPNDGASRTAGEASPQPREADHSGANLHALSNKSVVRYFSPRSGSTVTIVPSLIPLATSAAA